MHTSLRHFDRVKKVACEVAKPSSATLLVGPSDTGAMRAAQHTHSRVWRSEETDVIACVNVRELSLVEGEEIGKKSRQKCRCRIAVSEGSEQSRKAAKSMQAKARRDEQKQRESIGQCISGV